ncbi:hypothetical protein M404DRAFT_1005639 [Pisolithus tinctorius Marx 270]|uniref:Uncharacterized protein n=1 Tax=Pisolithus tinctorius Marx 270 TaxID=870435 RepID=A0A0C3NS49_PISTI|nr:hypothetical protein M404DRAFT_1005639 [Pisolithus tinctorius Marx 270]
MEWIWTPSTSFVDGYYLRTLTISHWVRPRNANSDSQHPASLATPYLRDGILDIFTIAIKHY